MPDPKPQRFFECGFLTSADNPIAVETNGYGFAVQAELEEMIDTIAAAVRELHEAGEFTLSSGRAVRWWILREEPVIN